MLNLKEVVEEVLCHVYDPIKAHEYYIRNRELKGRDPASPETPTKNRTKGSESTAAQKTDVNPNQAAKDATHRTIDAKLAEIELAMAPALGNGEVKKAKLYSDKDKQALKKIAEDRKAKLEKIANDLYNEKLKIAREEYSKLEAVPEVPKGLGVLETMRRQEKRAEKIAKIKGDSKLARETVSNTSSNLRQQVVDKALSDKTKIQTEASKKLKASLGGAVENANSEYQKLKQDLARLLGRP
jgi:hypothetical protein